MSIEFGVQFSHLFGTYGEFTVGTDTSALRACYILTKIRPGSSGQWESDLASQMLPWREIFDVEELTFDELVQRDLDDSRVAHDLIPYLIGEKDQSPRFFPPILAVLVPKEQQESSIGRYYPKLTIPEKNENVMMFEDLFQFEKIAFDGQLSPLGTIRYNRHRSRFVIVDGQHRAMAILALHRQLNKSWGSDRYASYYAHLKVSPDQLHRIELPVCVVFFPDMSEGGTVASENNLVLKDICREIFLVVNKNAKKVSAERELLLDDNDFAARMMRRTLSSLKNRGEENENLARIYSFAYGDSTENAGGTVVTGSTEYCSAISLHKIHAATVFGVADAFRFHDPADITDGRRTKNPARPGSILIGTELESLPTLSRWSGKYHPPKQVNKAVEFLGTVADKPLLRLFDDFVPFSVANRELRKLRTRLRDAAHQADVVQSKCYTLLFEGSGVLNVFEDHRKRLSEKVEEAKELGEEVGDYIRSQLDDARAVAVALEKHSEALQERRAERLFHLDGNWVSESATGEERATIKAVARNLYSTLATQAFQIGYVMAVHTVVEQLIEEENAPSYELRIGLTDFVSEILVTALNSFFDSDDSVRHRSFSGIIGSDRVWVFEGNRPGLRRLLNRAGVKELNERQWPFFRYAVWEMALSKYGRPGLKKVIDANSAYGGRFLTNLERVVSDILSLRESYKERAVSRSLDAAEFRQELETLAAHLEGEGRISEEIETAIEERKQEKAAEVERECNESLMAALGNLEDGGMMVAAIVSK